MKDFDKYLARSKRISESVEESGNGLGMTISWLMILVGVIVTAIQTHSLSLNGMKGSRLYADWLDVASWLPVILLEGTAIGLTLGRLYFFKGSEQRRLGFVASFAVWAVLAINTLCQFAISYSDGGWFGAPVLPAPLLFYTRYVLPLSIVAVPYLWKWLLDLHPDSQERIATLEAESQYNAQWRDIQREQRDQIITAYREAQTSPEVKTAITRMVGKAAIDRAAQIVGQIDIHDIDEARQKIAEDEALLSREQTKPRVVWQGGKVVENSRPN
ncbi:MAG: hypothetical protein ACREEM_20170 [Blastocatellia bacterium]